jgi:RNA methyltransferase, TrmH family
VSRRFENPSSRVNKPISKYAGVSQRHTDGAAYEESSEYSVITSKDNRWLKLFRAGLQGGGPKAGEAIAVEGPKLIDDALRAGLEAEALLVSTSGEESAQRILLAASATDDGISPSRILRTTDKLFESVAGTQTPQGVAALFRQPAFEMKDVLGSDGPALVVVLVGVQDPGNVGTAIRSAEAFGATGAIATRGTGNPWSPKALRASAGSALRLPTLSGLAIPALLAQLRGAKLKIIASMSSENPKAASLADVALGKACAIFVGSEGAGLPDEIIEAADATIAIPMAGNIESLNAGVAASILLYEAARQRTAGKI